MQTIYAGDSRVTETTQGLAFYYRGELRYVRPHVVPAVPATEDGSWDVFDADGHNISQGSPSADAAVQFFLGAPQTAAAAPLAAAQ